MSATGRPRSGITNACFCPPLSYRTACAKPAHRLAQQPVLFGYHEPVRREWRRVTIRAQITQLKKKAEPQRWKCMKHCGACCKLDDYDEEVLREMLNSEQDVVEYLAMIAKNGWCKWFDSFARRCTQYEERPRFCRATPETFQDLYGVNSGDFDEFAISCCEFHIENSYGAGSQEATRYSVFKELPYEQTRICEDERD